MNTFSVTVKCASEAAELFEFCAARGITLEEKAAVPITVPVVMSEEYLKPSGPMKRFCGPERANKYGLVQPKAALELVINTIQRSGLQLANDMVRLNESLQHALGTQLSSVMVADLAELVNATFTRPY